MIEVYYSKVDFENMENQIADINCKYNIESLVTISSKASKDRLRSMVGYAILFSVLQDKGVNNFIIKRDENGKPYLVDSEYYFNISHSGEYVMCAVSDNCIGIDIEMIREKVDNDAIARRFFAENEYNEISSATAKKKEIFTRIWSEKESYIKYLGLGMKKGMNTFYKDEGVNRMIDNNEVTKVICQSRKLENYCYSVCYNELESSGDKNILLKFVECY